MYVTSYKLNNSYTTYVIHDSDDDRSDDYTYRKPAPKLEWKKDAKVSHYFYGIGRICEITEHMVTVHFEKARVRGRMSNVQVSFEYNCMPNEIDSIRLCH